jgi:hypothetical protein
MRVSESRQIEERVYARVTPLENWRLKQTWRPLPSTGEDLLEFLEGGRIRGELLKRAVNGAVRSSPVILNIAFRPRHKLLQIF